MDIAIGPGKALVVDDEPAVARVVSRMLQRRGYACQAVHTPQAAIELVEQQHFDLVVSDLSMPERDGLDLLAEVTRIRPDAATVILTGYADGATAAHARESGVDAFMAKSADQDEIERALDEALMNKTLRLAVGDV